MSNTTTPAHTFTTDAYAASDASGKAKLRAAIATAIRDAVTATDFATASELVAIEKTFVTTRDAVTVDYVSRIADLRASLMAAVHAIDDGNVTMPEGATRPDYTPDMIVGGDIDTTLVARFTTVTGRKAGRGSVVAWIESVVDDTPATIAQLRARWTATTDYPKSAPSAGAIGAAFDRVADGADGDFTVVDVDGKRGAVAN